MDLRQAAIDAVRVMQTYKLSEGDDMLLVDQAEVMTELMMLPSAEPELATNLQPSCNQLASDCISRQAAINTVSNWLRAVFGINSNANTGVFSELLALPSAEPDALTDKEQRIFLAAMAREEKVCKQVDEECRDSIEPYEDSLVRTCHEIERKVKGALWT